MTLSPFEKAKALHFKGHLEEAKNQYQTLIQKDPKNPDLFHALSIVIAQLNQTDEAFRLINQAITLQPHNSAFLNTLGNLLLRKKLYRKAKDCFMQAIEINPQSQAALINLGNCQRLQKQPKLALNAYQKALALNRQCIDALYNLALLYLEMTQWNKAEQYLKQTLELSASYAPAHGHLGKLYLQQKKLKSAIAHFQSRLTIQPEHANTHYDLGLALMLQKHYPKALDALHHCQRIHPNHPEVHYHLATCYLHQGEYAKALEHYQAQLAIRPDEICYFNIGVLMMYDQKMQSALNYFGKTLAINPRHFDAHINIGSIYLSHQKKTQAISHYQKALNIRPDDQETAHILSALQQKKMAKTAPRDYIEHLFNQYAPYYDHHLKHHLHYQLPNKMYEWLCLKTLLMCHPISVLDLGCGTGLVGEKLKNHSSLLIGLDTSKNMLEVASQKQIYHQLIHQTIESGIKILGKFDLITAAEVFSYIGDLSDTFKACYDHLKPFGYLCFSIEQNLSSKPYQLQETIRYAHHLDYLSQMAKTHRFETCYQDLITLRQQNHQPQKGVLLLWQKRN